MTINTCFSHRGSEEF